MSQRDSGRPDIGVAAPKAQPTGSTPDDPPDEVLEAQWKQGSAPAFAILFERWHGRAYAFAMRRTNGDTTLSEDVAQRAFVNLYAKPPSGTGKGSWKTLLFTVVENELRTEARKRGRRKEQNIEVTLEARSSGSETPDATVADDDEKTKIQAALAELTDEERTVVLLREVEGLTFREVCEATGFTRDVVRGRLGKALARLRRALERRAS